MVTLKKPAETGTLDDIPKAVDLLMNVTLSQLTENEIQKLHSASIQFIGRVTFFYRHKANTK